MMDTLSLTVPVPNPRTVSDNAKQPKEVLQYRFRSQVSFCIRS